jgi:L-lactate dehydrogenase complex protein LldF
MARVFDTELPFPDLARTALADPQLRSNLARATSTIREKRKLVVGELGDWEDLRTAGAAIKDYVLDHLEELVVELEQNVTRNGGVVHWARTAAEANAIVVDLVQATSSTSVVKVKSMVTAEIELNAALEQHGIAAYETDLAELIVQLGNDLPSHILVPAIHKNRSQIQEIFLKEMGKSGLPAPPDLSNEPIELAAAARAHLRDRFLTATVGVSGANFLIANSGGLVIVESEGNGRMCLTLPDTLISVVGVEKILPDWKSLGVFLQLLPRSSTGERMNPYTSIFTGATLGNGPSQFHLVLLDNGRTSALAEPDGRDVLRCIRCSACLNVCPVYERTGGHAYGNPYPGPIGAVLVPQLRRGSRTDLENSLPYASSLCGACLEVCPVKIDIPKILIKLRSDVVDVKRLEHPRNPELLAMKTAEAVLSSPRRFTRLITLGGLMAKVVRRSKIRHLPPPLNKWTDGRDAPLPPTESFRSWFSDTHPHAQDTSLAAHSPKPPTRRKGARSSAISGPSPLEADQTRTSMLTAIKGASRTMHETLEHLPIATYRTVGALSSDDRIAQFHSRLIDYHASVTETTASQVGSCVAELLTKHGSTTIAAPADSPPSWSSHLTASVSYDDPALTIAELDSIDATISGCAAAISETGTIILDSGTRQGRRALSLIPDHLIVIVDEDQVVELVPEAVARLDSTAAQTWISGPSATSDIELERIEGVHGPRVLDVIIVRNDP